MVVTQWGAGVSKEIPLNVLQNNFKVTVAVITDSLFRGSYTVEMKCDTEWLAHPKLTNVSKSSFASIEHPVRAVRVSVKGSAISEVKLEAIQGA